MPGGSKGTGSPIKSALFSTVPFDARTDLALVVDVKWRDFSGLLMCRICLVLLQGKVYTSLGFTTSILVTVERMGESFLSMLSSNKSLTRGHRWEPHNRIYPHQTRLSRKSHRHHCCLDCYPRRHPFQGQDPQPCSFHPRFPIRSRGAACRRARQGRERPTQVGRLGQGRPCRPSCRVYPSLPENEKKNSVRLPDNR